MSDSTLVAQLLDQFNRLEREQQERVVAYVRSLPTSLQGVAGSSYANFAGILSSAEADQLAQAIEDGCERIDADEW